MLNVDKYRDAIMEKGGTDIRFGMDKTTKEIESCRRADCHNCLFRRRGGCAYRRLKWLFEEPIVLTQKEYHLLMSLDDRWKYIIKTEYGNVYVHDEENNYLLINNKLLPENSFFFLDEKSWDIKKLLKNSEVKQNGKTSRSMVHVQSALRFYRLLRS